jgi:hypothetical protein
MTQAGKGEISLVEVFPGALEEMATFGTREFRGWILVAEYDVAYKGERHCLRGGRTGMEHPCGQKEKNRQYLRLLHRIKV